jgi:hypothetical protein
VLDVLGIGVAVGCVEIGDRLETLLGKAVAGQPARGFGEDEGHGKENEGKTHLDEVRALPGLVLGDEEVEAKINPSRERISTNEKRVLDAYHETSAVWRSNLSLNNRHSHGEEAYTQALQSTTDNECLEVRGEGLDEGGYKVDEAAKSNALFSSNHISKTACNERADGGRDLETSDKNARDIGVDVIAGAISTSKIPEES